MLWNDLKFAAILPLLEAMPVPHVSGNPILTLNGRIKT